VTDLYWRQHDVVVLDKESEWIERQIVGPRERNDAIFINGQVIEWPFIVEIHITKTDRTSEDIIPEIRARRMARRIATPMTDEWYVTREGLDVTDEFIFGAPGTKSEKSGSDTDEGAANPSAEVDSTGTERATNPGSEPIQPSINPAANPEQRDESGKILDFLATPRSTAVVGIISLVLTVAALIVSVAVLGIIGVATAISFLVIEILSRRRPLVIAIGSLVTLTACFPLVRYYSYPGTTYFGYDDSLMSAPNSSPFAGLSKIPLTIDPNIGTVYTSIPAGDGGFTSLNISCLQQGYFDHRQVLWVKIVGGPYESLWIPWTYLAGIQPGSARTILSCNNWRWTVHNI